MLLIVLSLILTVIAYFLCSKNSITITTATKNYLFIFLVTILTILMYLSFGMPYMVFLFYGMFILSIILVIKKSGEYLSLFFIKKIENLILLISAISISASILIYYTPIVNQTSPQIAQFLLIGGIMLSIYARLGYVALSTYIAKSKNRSIYFGLLGVFGILGVLISCMLGKK